MLVIESIFVDKFIGLPKPLGDLMVFAKNSSLWSSRHNMVLATAKSCGFCPPRLLSLYNNNLREKSSLSFFRLIGGPTGPGDDFPSSRIEARTIPARITKSTSCWRTTLMQLRTFRKTFIYPIKECSLYLQLLTEKWIHKGASLDLKWLTYISGIPVQPYNLQSCLRRNRIL